MTRDPSQPSKPLTGELVVRAGPDRGTSRPLLVPFTLVGSAEHCDLRILDFLCRPVHCAVSVTPEGPHLRSLGGTTIVNGVPTQERLLQTGDVVTIGPISLEVRWYLPPTPTPNSGVVKPSSIHTTDTPATETGVLLPIRKIAKMRTRLTLGRLQLVRERLALRSDFRRQLIDVSELRNEGETLKVEAVMELAHVRQLRRQFLRQWKRYWRRKRVQLQYDTETLNHDRHELDAQWQHLNDERSKFDADRNELKTVHDDCRRRCQKLEDELTQRTQDLDRRETQLVEREQALVTEHATHNQLRTELAGLEARIQHLRTSLPNDAPLAVPDVNIPPVSERFTTLQDIAHELADQQHALATQIEDLTHAAQTQTDTHVELVSVLESFANELLRRETGLAEQQQRLDIWQARLLEQQIGVEQQTAQVAHDSQRTTRHQGTIDRLCERWSERRRSELVKLQEALAEVARLRGHVEQQRLELAQRETKLTHQAQNVALEHVALEKRRSELLPQRNDEIDGKVERRQRRLRALFAKDEVTQDERLQEIRDEAAALETLHAQTLERLTTLAMEQRELSETAAELEQRELTVTQNAADRDADSLQRQAQLLSAERYIQDLRAEIIRLTNLLEANSTAPRRAA